jgi:hypothetical protein
VFEEVACCAGTQPRLLFTDLELQLRVAWDELAAENRALREMLHKKEQDTEALTKEVTHVRSGLISFLRTAGGDGCLPALVWWWW